MDPRSLATTARTILCLYLFTITAGGLWRGGGKHLPLAWLGRHLQKERSLMIRDWEACYTTGRLRTARQREAFDRQ